MMEKAAKPKLLFISAARTIGGGEIYLATLLPLLNDKYECTVLGTPPVLKILDNSATVHRIILFPRFIERLIKRNYRLKKTYYKLYFRCFLRKNSFDLINLQEFDGAFIESINFRPIVLTEQTRLFIPAHLKSWSVGLFDKIDKVICVSQRTLEDVTELGVPKSKCVVIRSGVDTSRLKPPKTDGEYITWVGRVEEDDKNPLLFLQIAEAAQAGSYDYRFRLVGGGGALQRMRDYAKRHNLTNLEISGPKPHNEMAMVYAETKLLCMTSKTEGMPLTVLEAMACGRPVVATNVGGLKEIIDTPQAGRLIDGFDHNEFLDQISHLIEDKDLYRKVSHAARARVEKEFSIVKQFEQMSRQYDSLLERQ